MILSIIRHVRSKFVYVCYLHKNVLVYSTYAEIL
jgi:hypothetical protein